jgi:hypothetical protein
VLEARAVKHVFVLDRRNVGPEGFLVKQAALDLLNIPDPNLISLPARPDDFGLGDPFQVPFETIESLLPLDGDRLLLVNDFGALGPAPERRRSVLCRRSRLFRAGDDAVPFRIRRARVARPPPQNGRNVHVEKEARMFDVSQRREVPDEPEPPDTDDDEDLAGGWDH